MSTQEAKLVAREASFAARKVDLTTKVEFLRGKVDTACDEARGKGVQAGYRIFCRISLQLQPNFDIKALEALVILEVVS